MPQRKSSQVRVVLMYDSSSSHAMRLPRMVGILLPTQLTTPVRGAGRAVRLGGVRAGGGGQAGGRAQQGGGEPVCEGGVLCAPFGGPGRRCPPRWTPTTPGACASWRTSSAPGRTRPSRGRGNARSSRGRDGRVQGGPEAVLQEAHAPGMDVVQGGEHRLPGCSAGTPMGPSQWRS